MAIISQVFPDLAPILNISTQFFLHGLPFKFGWVFSGWIYFILGMVYLLWKSYLLEIQHQFVHNNKFIFLNIRVPKENMVSTLAVETIFSQLHALHVAKTFAEKYVEGQFQLWYSLEIVSFGGKISFIMRIPEKMKYTVEAAFYAHYPQAEITEVDDYIANYNYNVDDPNEPTEMFGTEWKLTADEVIPIKTYKDFEHSTAEESIIDPLANLFEALSKIEPHEVFAIQIIIQPLGDEEWKPKAEAKIQELIGAEAKHDLKFSDSLLSPINKFAKFSYKEALLAHSHGHGEEGTKPKTNWLSMTEGEKERVSLIEQKIGKPGYKTKIRFLYIAPKDKYDPSRRSLIIGAYRPLGSVMTNKLKPDTSTTWTGTDYVFSKGLEAPYLDWVLKYKKKHFIRGYKQRDVHIGIPMFILNTDEIATLYHFPITTKTTTVQSSIERTASKKGQPPSDLPVLE